MAAILQTMFEFIFLNDKYGILIEIPLKFVPQDLIDWLRVSTGCGNGLLPNRWQAIIEANDSPF